MHGLRLRQSSRLTICWMPPTPAQGSRAGGQPRPPRARLESHAADNSGEKAKRSRPSQRGSLAVYLEKRTPKTSLRRSQSVLKLEQEGSDVRLRVDMARLLERFKAHAWHLFEIGVIYPRTYMGFQSILDSHCDSLEQEKHMEPEQLFGMDR